MADRGPGMTERVLSTLLSRASAAALLVGGTALLFASDALLPRLIPGYPPSGSWLGQLLAAAWLALATLNRLGQRSLLGGIYGRPIVAANVAAFFIGALALLKVVLGTDAPAAVWIVLVPYLVLAVLYGWLLLRGPLERDLARHRAASREPG